MDKGMAWLDEPSLQKHGGIKVYFVIFFPSRIFSLPGQASG